MITQARRIAGTEVFAQEAEPLVERHHFRLVRTQFHAADLQCISRNLGRFPRFRCRLAGDGKIVGVPDHGETVIEQPVIHLAEHQVGQQRRKAHLWASPRTTPRPRPGRIVARAGS